MLISSARLVSYANKWLGMWGEQTSANNSTGYSYSKITQLSAYKLAFRAKKV